jgi:transposase
MSHNGNSRIELNSDQTAVSGASAPDPEVVPKATRRKFTGEYKERILAQADACTKPGQIGALLRREGLYRSHLADWREQRKQFGLAGLASQRRGPKPDPQAAEIARLQRENERLLARLRRAENIIDVQKKLAQLPGAPLDETESDEQP